MPEGDTLFRAARALRAYLVGRAITAADARDVDLHASAQRLVGTTVERVEARAKHLLIHVEGGLVVHSHMKMNGSWRLTDPRDLWSARGEVLSLTAGTRMAVCRNAPVVHIVEERELGRVPGLRTLGPDVLRGANADAIAARVLAVASDMPMGDVLLDQRLVAGLGNIWRCEALFAARLNPATPAHAAGAERIAAAVTLGADLMGRAAVGTRPRPEVYGRHNRPCRRCGTPIAARRMGRDARTAYWCPKCQAPNRESV